MEELCNDFAAVLESERAAGHTLSFLVSIHCDGVSEGQGYYRTRPLYGAQTGRTESVKYSD